MNSVVRLRQPGEDRDLTVRLIFPSKEESSEEAVSVLDPLGMAMLGYRVGDSVFVTRNGITESYVIDSIPYQPEASGDYQL
jgi:regulator of nucleoside diphosphate kinase